MIVLGTVFVPVLANSLSNTGSSIGLPFLLLDVILWILSMIYIHCFQGSIEIFILTLLLDLLQILKNISIILYLCFLFGGTLALNELQFDSGEQKHLNELLTQSSSKSTVRYLVGLAEFLSKTIPIISSSFELLFDKYRLIQTRRVDVVPIGHKSNVTYSYINDNVLKFSKYKIT